MLVDAVSYALDLEDVIPEGVGYLDVVLDGSRVSELRFLSDADELLDVKPFAFEKSCIVRYRIICIVVSKADLHRILRLIMPDR